MRSEKARDHASRSAGVQRRLLALFFVLVAAGAAGLIWFAMHYLSGLPWGG